MKRKSTLPERISPLDTSADTRARTFERNKGRTENRAISTAPVHADDIGFPFARQVALVLRQTSGRRDESVALITSAEPDRLNAPTWLRLNRGGWGIEAMHQRLDISHSDDRCRVQHTGAIWILGMFRRLANSLFMEWRAHQPQPLRLTTTHFQALLARENHRRAIRLVTIKTPSLKKLS